MGYDRHGRMPTIPPPVTITVPWFGFPSRQERIRAPDQERDPYRDIQPLPLDQLTNGLRLEPREEVRRIGCNSHDDQADDEQRDRKNLYDIEAGSNEEKKDNARNR